MARLIDVGAASPSPPTLTVKVGDVLMFSATGGRVRSGPDVIVCLGAFVSSTVGNDGLIYAPAGAPNTVLFAAQRPGNAAFDVITGDPWHSTRTIPWNIIVE